MPTERTFIIVAVCVTNIIFIIWFIGSINKIKSTLTTIASYQRRTALALPLTSGQAKLINRSFTAIELISLLEKQGAILRIEEIADFGGILQFALKIDQHRAVDPELVDLAFLWEAEIIESVKTRSSTKNIE